MTADADGVGVRAAPASAADLLASAVALRWSRPDLTAAVAEHVAETWPADLRTWLAATGWLVHGRSAVGDGRTDAVASLAAVARRGAGALDDPAADRLRIELAALAVEVGEPALARLLVDPVLARGVAECRADALTVLARCAIDERPSTVGDAIRLAEQAWCDVAGSALGVATAGLALLSATVLRRTGQLSAAAAFAADAVRRLGEVDHDRTGGPARHLAAALLTEWVEALVDDGRAAEARAHCVPMARDLCTGRATRQTALLRLAMARALADAAPAEAFNALEQAVTDAATCDAPGIESLCLSALGASGHETTVDLISRSAVARHRDRERTAGLRAALRALAPPPGSCADAVVMTTPAAQDQVGVVIDIDGGCDGELLRLLDARLSGVISAGGRTSVGPDGSALWITGPGWTRQSAAEWMYRTLPSVFLAATDLDRAVSGADSRVAAGRTPASTQLRAAVHDGGGPVGARLLHRIDPSPRTSVDRRPRHAAPALPAVDGTTDTDAVPIADVIDTADGDDRPLDLSPTGDPVVRIPTVATGRHRRGPDGGPEHPRNGHSCPGNAADPAEPGNRSNAEADGGIAGSGRGADDRAPRRSRTSAAADEFSDRGGAAGRGVDGGNSDEGGADGGSPGGGSFDDEISREECFGGGSPGGGSLGEEISGDQIVDGGSLGDKSLGDEFPDGGGADGGIADDKNPDDKISDGDEPDGGVESARCGIDDRAPRLSRASAADDRSHTGRNPDGGDADGGVTVTRTPRHRRARHRASDREQPMVGRPATTTAATTSVPTTAATTTTVPTTSVSTTSAPTTAAATTASATTASATTASATTASATTASATTASATTAAATTAAATTASATAAAATAAATTAAATTPAATTPAATTAAATTAAPMADEAAPIGDLEGSDRAESGAVREQAAAVGAPSTDGEEFSVEGWGLADLLAGALAEYRGI